MSNSDETGRLNLIMVGDDCMLRGQVYEQNFNSAIPYDEDCNGYGEKSTNLFQRFATVSSNDSPNCFKDSATDSVKIVKMPPKIGDGGNWKCEQCNNINYPRRKNCNRCRKPRSPENDMLVAEFNRNKQEFQIMGLNDPSAAEQQAACKSSSGCLHQYNVFNNQQVQHDGFVGTPVCTRSTTAAPSPYNLPVFFPNGFNNIIKSTDSLFSSTISPQRCPTMSYMDTSFVAGAPQGMLELQYPLGIEETVHGRSPILSTSCIMNNGSLIFPASAAVGMATAPEPIQTLQHPLQVILLKAKDIAEKLVQDFQNLGENGNDSTNRACEVLTIALTMLGQSYNDVINSVNNPDQNHGFSNALPPTILAHPDEFKNPSSFLKIYGDPSCISGFLSGHNPMYGENGNWICCKCKNVNFPRRFRCNKCNELRDSIGDKIVAEYAKSVYHYQSKAYRKFSFLKNS